jgi:excisionase family DNA binding protein
VSQDERDELVKDGAVGIAEAEKLTGLGRTNLYGLMASLQLKYLKIGRRRLIPRSEITRLLSKGLIGG